MNVCQEKVRKISYFLRLSPDIGASFGITDRYRVIYVESIEKFAAIWYNTDDKFLRYRGVMSDAFVQSLSVRRAPALQEPRLKQDSE